MTVYLQTLEDGTAQYAKGLIYLDDGQTFDYIKKEEYTMIKFEFKNNTLSGMKLENSTYHTKFAKVENIIIIGLKNITALDKTVLTYRMITDTDAMTR